MYMLFRSSIYIYRYIAEFYNLITNTKNYSYENATARFSDGLLVSSRNTFCFVNEK